MARRKNHRGWVVLESINADDGLLCVDFFEHPDGGFGFEQLRADPEDGGRWTAVGGYAGARYETVDQATDTAIEAISWLRFHPGARTALAAWRQQLQG